MTPCIEGVGFRDKGGYVKLHREGRTWMAHRWAWVQAHGPIPAGMCVLHHCDNPPCINIEHLWLGTIADNNRDMTLKGRGRTSHRRKTRCKRGHELSGDNLYLYQNKNGPNKDGWRHICKACVQASVIHHYNRRQAGIRMAIELGVIP